MKIAICDDEIIYLNYIKMLCNEFLSTRNTICEIVQFTSGEQLLAFDEDIDILLLDIEMSEMNGINVKENLIKRKKNIIIIYISSHTELMQDAFGKNVYSFFTKPIVKQKFYDIMEHILNEIEDDFIVEIDNKEMPFIKRRTIVYIKAEDKYTKVFTRDNMYIVRRNMNEWMRILEGHHFYRTHKSFIVNFAFIKKISKDIYLTNDITVKISRKNTKEFQEMYFNYIKQKV